MAALNLRVLDSRRSPAPLSMPSIAGTACVLMTLPGCAPAASSTPALPDRTELTSTTTAQFSRSANAEDSA